MAQLWHLYQLGQTDTSIDKKKAEKEKLGPPAALKQEADEIVEKITGLKEELKQLHLKIKKLELETDSITDHRKILEKKIYSGKTTNSKELQNWQSEIEHLLTKQNEKEEIQLEMMETMESLENSIKEYIEKEKQKKEEIIVAQNLQKTETVRLEKEISELTVKRDKLAAAIEPSTLHRYEQLRLSTFDGVAVVKIVSNSCGGCYMSVPMSMIRQVQAHHLTTCNNCMRILFWDDK